MSLSKHQEQLISHLLVGSATSIQQAIALLRKNPTMKLNIKINSKTLLQYALKHNYHGLATVLVKMNATRKHVGILTIYALLGLHEMIPASEDKISWNDKDAQSALHLSICHREIIAKQLRKKNEEYNKARDSLNLTGQEDTARFIARGNIILRKTEQAMYHLLHSGVYSTKALEAASRIKNRQIAQKISMLIASNNKSRKTHSCQRKRLRFTAATVLPIGGPPTKSTVMPTVNRSCGL